MNEEEGGVVIPSLNDHLQPDDTARAIEASFDDWSEDEEIEVKSLFSDTFLSSIESLVEHDKKNFNFDLGEVVVRFKLDEIAIIMLVNYIRSTALAPSTSSSSASSSSSSSAANMDTAYFSKLHEDINAKLFINEEYMKPVVKNDPLLYLLSEYLDLEEEDDDDDGLDIERVSTYKREQIEKNPEHKEVLELIKRDI